MIDEEGYIKITEVSTFKIIEDRTYSLVGTPEYMAPEIFLSQGYDFATDYWSLGVCLYELLTGEQPFCGNDIIELFNDVTSKCLKSSHTMKFPTHFRDETAKDLISKLLVYNPEQRLTNPKLIRSH